MESFIGNIQKENKRTESSGEIGVCDTTRAGIGRQGPGHIYKNTTWIFRLEWKC
tara:strand:- start:2791 stop:2952 length:162 start_codon:yes stop_codon:yes gene_type:complete